MSELEKMKRHIAKTKMPFPRRQYYKMGADELDAFLSGYAAGMGRADILFLVFLYGRAKGYRLAKAEVRE